MALTKGNTDDESIPPLVLTSECINSPLFNPWSSPWTKDNKSHFRGLSFHQNRRASSPRRFRRLVGNSRARFVGFGAALLMVFVYVCLLNLSGRTSPSPASYPSSRGGYTVLINTWKRYSLLKKTVGHYASCSRVSEIRVVWSESDPPTDDLTLYLMKTVSLRSQNSQKPTFRFEINEEDNLNNRFKPIKGLKNDAVFSVDDDLIVPCSTLDFAFSVWQTAPDAMVGFVPRMHWPEEKNGVTLYNYGGWWSVWWTGTYSMVLTKAALFHQKYLDMYTNNMPSSIREYVARERNCEDIAMSLLVANATGASPIWIKGKIYEIGSFGISSLKGHNDQRNKCLNEFISVYGTSPLISTNMKAVDSRQEWFW